MALVIYLVCSSSPSSFAMPFSMLPVSTCPFERMKPWMLLTHSSAVSSTICPSTPGSAFAIAGKWLNPAIAHLHSHPAHLFIECSAYFYPHKLPHGILTIERNAGAIIEQGFFQDLR